MLLEATGGVAAALAGSMAWAVRGRSSRVFGRSVFRGVRERRSVALTFDDGPSESTMTLLDLLDRHAARATFFLCGAHVRRLPDAAREIVRRGHQLGNHSDTHACFCLRSRAFIWSEVARAQQTIAEITGVAPTFFRAPYGVRWFGLGEVQEELGLTGVMWTAIARDWKLPADGIVRRLATRARNGAIFCLHDGRGPGAAPDIRNTLEALDVLLPQLAARSYQFETVSQILCPTT